MYFLSNTKSSLRKLKTYTYYIFVSSSDQLSGVDIHMSRDFDWGLHGRIEVISRPAMPEAAPQTLS